MERLGRNANEVRKLFKLDTAEKITEMSAIELISLTDVSPVLVLK